MTVTFKTINPLDQVVDFISCLPAVGIFITASSSLPVEGLASKILTNDESDQSRNAQRIRTLSISQKIDILKIYGKECSLGAISGVTTIALFVALTVLTLCPLIVGVIFCVGGIGAAAIGAIQIYRVNHFIRAQTIP